MTQLIPALPEKMQMPSKMSFNTCALLPIETLSALDP